jgi:phage/plasmid-associated DNA primase
MLLMLGTPGGGKSTLMTILELTIGLTNVAQLRTEHLGKPFELFAFSGKTLLTGKDVLADFLSQKSASYIKSLVGGDLLDAEKKGFNQRVQIRGCFNVGITCNADLNIRLEGDTGAWRRRLMVVRYDRPPVTKRIPGYAEMLLKEEGPGILRWMIDGAIELLRDLEEAGDYILTEAQKQRVDKLLEQSESIKLFVRDGLIKGGTTSLTTAELKAEYQVYCENHGMQPMHYLEVSPQLKRYMLEIHQKSERNDILRDGRSQRGFKGIRVRGEVGNED